MLHAYLTKAKNLFQFVIFPFFFIYTTILRYNRNAFKKYSFFFGNSEFQNFNFFFFSFKKKHQNGLLNMILKAKSVALVLININQLILYNPFIFVKFELKCNLYVSIKYNYMNWTISILHCACHHDVYITVLNGFLPITKENMKSMNWYL